MSFTFDLSPDLPWFEQELSIEETTYFIEMWWDVRIESWYISLFDENFDPIRVGRKASLNYSLFWRTVDPRMYDGALAFIRSSDLRGRIRRVELGEGVDLVYFSPDELVDFTDFGVGEPDAVEVL